MELDILKQLEADIDFILEGKKISNSVKKNTLNIIKYEAKCYSHSILSHRKKSLESTGFFGHLNRKNVKVDLFKHIKNYINSKKNNGN